MLLRAAARRLALRYRHVAYRFLNVDGREGLSTARRSSVCAGSGSGGGRGGQSAKAHTRAAPRWVQKVAGKWGDGSSTVRMKLVDCPREERVPVRATVR